MHTPKYNKYYLYVFRTIENNSHFTENECEKKLMLFLNI